MQSIITIFRAVRDPRDRNRRHDLGAMLVVALAATLCGAKTCVAIADFAEANGALLGELVALPHGAPSHDTFSRVFRLLDPEELARALERFHATVRAALGLGPARGVIAIDAKSLRRGYEAGRAWLPPLLVSVWDAETRLTLTARRAGARGEIGAALAALKSLTLKGCIVTADALHCHPEMAAAVRARGAQYALTLKANNGPLYRAATAAFAAGAAPDRHARSERAHGRTERRRASVVAAPAQRCNLPGLAAFARIDSQRRRGAKLERETRYVALSRRLSAQRVLEVVRSHWSIENHLHWQLDVVFHEDDARSRKDHAPQNLAVLRRIALDILRAHPADKSIARKMHLAAWSRPFFFQLFAHLR